MSTQDPSRSARNSRPKRNTTMMHYCNICSAKWLNERRQFRCPHCKYSVPRGADKKFEVISYTELNTNAEGRIICHVAKPKQE